MAVNSTLWVTPSQLGGTAASDPLAIEACSMASYILWAFSGRRYGVLRTVTETYECACSKTGLGTFDPFALPAVDGTGLVVNTLSGTECGCTGTVGGRHVRLRLKGSPVRRVHSVRRDTVELDPATYRVENSGLLTLDPGAPGDVCGLEVTYTYGAGIPGGGRQAARTLAQELLRSWNDDEECRLPDRTTNVSRQGVSFTVLDKQDFLDEFKTGILEIDLFLRAANPAKALKKAKVFSVDLPKAYRRTANGVPVPPINVTVRPYDLHITPGAQLLRGFRRYDSSGAAIDLSPYSFLAQVRGGLSETAPLVDSWTSFLSLSGTDPSLLELDVPAGHTATLPEGFHYWDLYIWQTAAGPSTAAKWLEGFVTVEA